MKSRLFLIALFILTMASSTFATVYMMRGHMVTHNFGSPDNPIYVSRFVCGGGHDEVCAEITVYDGNPSIVYCSPAISPANIPMMSPISGSDFSGQFLGYNHSIDADGNDVHEWQYIPAPTPVN